MCIANKAFVKYDNINILIADYFLFPVRSSMKQIVFFALIATALISSNNAMEGNETTPLIKAKSGDNSSWHFLRLQYNPQYALIHYIKAGSLPEVKKVVIDKGANVNKDYVADSIWTPLLYAADNGNMEIAKFLIEKGANPKTHLIYSKYPGSGYSCPVDKSASELACEAGNQELAAYLREQENK